MWDPDRCYLEGLAFFTERVRGVSAADAWARPSPCAGWRAVDVLGHVGAGTRFGTELLRGAEPSWSPPPDPPGAVVDGDPGAWWEQLVGPARDAVDGADLTQVVDSPMGRRSIGEGLTFPAIDLFVHGWDLARVAGEQVDVPDEAIEFAHRALDALPSAMIRTPQVFADAIDTPSDASASDAFLAWTGRDPAWQAP